MSPSARSAADNCGSSPISPIQTPSAKSSTTSSSALRHERRLGAPRWDVTVVTDASGGASVEAHEVAIQRMSAAGANMMTWLAVASEWQRDWARTEHVAELAEILKHHAGASGIAFLWEQQLLNTPVPSIAS
jgi:nicotinamidase-related amidase